MYDILGGSGGMISRNIVTMYIHFHLHAHVFSSDCRCDDVSVQCVCDILHMSVITHVQYGTSPLMAAAGKGKTDVVCDLIQAGANINLQDKVCHYIQ